MPIHKIKFFSGRSSRYLAEKIVASYGTTLGDSEVLQFSDGEFQPYYNESIRGCTVFIIQSTFPPSDNLMELLMMIDAARRASAYKVVAVIPYFGWARQDRKDRPRVPIGAKLVANLLMAAGVDRIMTMDLHADQIQGFFDIPVDALYASGIFIPYIQSLQIEDLSIAAPDMGGAKRANTYAKLLGTPIIISHKERAKANVVGKMTAIGDVEGRNVLIVDFGTAVTIDLVTADATYRGGCISPGVQLRFGALHDHTAALPLCRPSDEEGLQGLTTEEAVTRGVMNSVAFEIEGYIRRMEAQIDGLCVIFTGGDAKYFVKRIKNTIFASCNLVYCGLERILEYNASEEYLD